MSETRPTNPPMPPLPPPPPPAEPADTKPKRRRRISDNKKIAWMTFGLLVLAAVTAYFTWILVKHENAKPIGPTIETRPIEVPVPAKDVRVVVRPPEGTPAKGFQLKTLGQPVTTTDTYGECSFDGACRGCSADLFDATGKFLATIILPVAGHLEVKIIKPEPVKG